MATFQAVGGVVAAVVGLTLVKKITSKKTEEPIEEPIEETAPVEESPVEAAPAEVKPAPEPVAEEPAAKEPSPNASFLKRQKSLASGDMIMMQSEVQLSKRKMTMEAEGSYKWSTDATDKGNVLLKLMEDGTLKYLKQHAVGMIVEECKQSVKTDCIGVTLSGNELMIRFGGKRACQYTVRTPTAAEWHAELLKFGVNNGPLMAAGVAA